MSSSSRNFKSSTSLVSPSHIIPRVQCIEYLSEYLKIKLYSCLSPTLILRVLSTWCTLHVLDLELWYESYVETSTYGVFRGVVKHEYSEDGCHALESWVRVPTFLGITHGYRVQSTATVQMTSSIEYRVQSTLVDVCSSTSTRSCEYYSFNNESESQDFAESHKDNEFE